MSYRSAAICENGHCISSFLTFGEHSEDIACSECGAKIISKCPKCGASIREKLDSDYAAITEYTIPKYCFSCGQPFPWIQLAIDSARKIIEEDDQIEEDFQQKLRASLPDIVSDTPQTKLACTRFKKAFLSVGKFTAEGLRQFVIDFGCEAAKRLLLP